MNFFKEMSFKLSTDSEAFMKDNPANIAISPIVGLSNAIINIFFKINRLKLNVLLWSVLTYNYEDLKLGVFT